MNLALNGPRYLSASLLAADTVGGVEGAVLASKYVLLTTFRRDGTPVATPVWFVVHDDALVVWTGTASGKVKRVRGNQAVTIAPCDIRGAPVGPSQPGRARLLDSAAVHDQIQRLLTSRYGITMRLVSVYGRVVHWVLRRAQLVPAYIEIRVL